MIDASFRDAPSPRPSLLNRTLVDLLLERARDSSPTAAATQKRDGVWEDVSWRALLVDVRRASAALVALGIKPGERVAIFAATSLRFLVADLSVNAARGISVPIYASNTPEETRYILQNSEAKALFVDGDEREGRQEGRATRVRQIAGDCPALEKVILFTGKPQAERELGWDRFAELGAEAERELPTAFDERAAAILTTDPSCFLYTSGTTGDPKGVILTHQAWCVQANAIQSIRLMESTDASMLFLPLAHSFGQTVKASWLGLGFRLILAESTEKLVQNILETSPTSIPTVPRVLEKIYNNVLSQGLAAPGVKGKLFKWALGLFDEYAEARIAGRPYDTRAFRLANRLVFKQVAESLQAKLGGRMRMLISGGAPLSQKIGLFFDLLGFQVLEGYGLTETSAGATVNTPSRKKTGSVGQALPGVELQIAADGEILIRGKHLMTGYFKNEAATREAMDATGWFHSGDIGTLDSEGFLRITDRKKDIIVTAGGKNVAPQNLENALKTAPIVSQAMVYGDKRKFLSVLITIQEDVARKLLSDAGASPVTTYAELAKRPEVHQAVREAVDALNAHEPPYNQLKKFAVLHQDFTQESGELTPTLKVKRKVAVQNYRAILDAFYEGDFAD